MKKLFFVLYCVFVNLNCFSQVLIHCRHMWVPTAYVDYIFNILKGLLVYKTLKMDSTVYA